MASMRKSGWRCREHAIESGDPSKVCENGNRFWLCDICAIQNHNPCKCGGNARTFGEALFQCTGCEECDEFVSGVALDNSTRDLWNQGIRGSQN